MSLKEDTLNEYVRIAAPAMFLCRAAQDLDLSPVEFRDSILLLFASMYQSSLPINPGRMKPSLRAAVIEESQTRLHRIYNLLERLEGNEPS